MRFETEDPARTFEVGLAKRVMMRDCGDLWLEPEEQVTLRTPEGAEYDVARKAWGFYATPSINARLPEHGLNAVLVRSSIDRWFVVLVEDGHEDLFERYVQGEGLVVVSRMDATSLARLEEAHGPAATPGADIMGGADLRCPCGTDDREHLHHFSEPPEGESIFDLRGQPYARDLWGCRCCGHVLSTHALDLAGLYDGEYVDATYGDVDGLGRTFRRIIDLPPERSDNVGRVARVRQFAAAHFGDANPRSLLDVGSGLGVFPHAMTLASWEVTALDPDARAASHIRTAVGVPVIAGDFLTLPTADLGVHDVVTFNKVLEHVTDPVAMLERAHDCLAPDGFVYVELPDAEGAAEEGLDREEFFIEHHHVFSFASLALLAGRAGFRVVTQERLREPSSKFTLRAFLNSG